MRPFAQFCTSTATPWHELVAAASRWLPRAAATAALAVNAGCALLAPAPPAAPELTAAVAAAPTASTCLLWYAALDRAVAHSGVHDAAAHVIPGFPQFRVDRFAASFADPLSAPLQNTAANATRDALLDYLRALDREARGFELANLPRESREALALTDAATSIALLDNCSRALARSVRDDAQAVAALRSELRVPDHYADWKRVLGLYPLTSIPFFAGISNWQRDTAQVFANSAAADAVAPAAGADASAGRVRYMPGADAAQAGAAIERYAMSPRNALGIPQLADAEWAALLAHYAPVFDVDARSASDRAGALRRVNDGVPVVDADSAVAYQRIAFSRYRGQTLTQLVYTLWFAERPAAHAFDLLSGRLDGVMIRITLDEAGSPLLVDSIHACGCYHLFFPAPQLKPRPPPQANIEWVFIPAALPPLAAGQRLQLSLAASTHYLSDLRAVDGAARAGDVRYTLRDDNSLRSLPMTATGRMSAFGADGIIAGSERGERFLFWPMGVASPGAMRQWGSHATAFVGRRHFDDADLIEQRFEIAPAPASDSGASEAREAR